MKIIIADGHSLYRSGLSNQLQKINNSFSVIECKNYDELFAEIKKNNDISYIFIDVDMPSCKCDEGLKNLFALKLNAKVIVISGNEDPTIVKYAIDNGVFSYISKNAELDFLNSALTTILGNENYVPHFLKQKTETQLPFFVRKVGTQLKHLTKRQYEVLKYLGEGCSNKEIAHSLNVSEATVKLHINSLLRIMQVKNRTQAVLIAQKKGIAP